MLTDGNGKLTSEANTYQMAVPRHLPSQGGRAFSEARNTSSGNSVARATFSSSLGQSGSVAAPAASAPSVGAGSASSAGQSGLIQLTNPSSRGQSSGGGASGSGASLGSGSNGGMLAIVAPVSRVSASAPAPVRSRSGQLASAPGASTLELYTEDKPGVIIGEDNYVNDNPIINSYGQPIGDMLWPLLLMAVGYALWRRRKIILTRR